MGVHGRTRVTRRRVSSRTSLCHCAPWLPSFSFAFRVSPTPEYLSEYSYRSDKRTDPTAGSETIETLEFFARLTGWTASIPAHILWDRSKRLYWSLLSWSVVPSIAALALLVLLLQGDFQGEQ
jgi:hypothetical protein